MPNPSRGLACHAHAKPGACGNRECAKVLTNFSGTSYRGLPLYVARHHGAADVVTDANVHVDVEVCERFRRARLLSGIAAPEG